MDWKEYEKVTKHIYETLGKESGVKIVCYGNDCKVKGKTGVEHQVDVLTQHSDGIHTYKTAIECKHWADNINKDVVMKVEAIVKDAGLNKGVIVSKNGFTPDAIAYAKHNNIGLVELREMTDIDWEGRLKTIKVELNMLMPQVTNVDFKCSDLLSVDSEKIKAYVSFLQIKNASGEIIEFATYITDFFKELTTKKEGEEFDKTYDLETGSMLIYPPGKIEVSITAFKISGVLRIHKSTFSINGEDHIWLIMKSIFEEKTYTIGKDGEVRERE